MWNVSLSQLSMLCLLLCFSEALLIATLYVDSDAINALSCLHSVHGS
jgi:hypothetical protein